MVVKVPRPYNQSLSTLFEFCMIWNCHITNGSTRKPYVFLKMPVSVFKKIFGTNPRQKEYPVPRNAEKFMSWVKVRYVKATNSSVTHE